MTSTPPSSASEDLRASFLAFRHAVFERHEFDAIARFLHPDFSSSSPMLRGRGPAMYADFARLLLAGLPDLRPLEQVVLVEGTQLMAMTQWAGTHAGNFLGAPPTGRALRFATADRYETQDGLLLRHWDVVDRLEASIEAGLLRRAAP